MCRFRSSCTFAKYHPGPCSPFIHSVISVILFADSEGPDQTEHMAYVQADMGLFGRICPKTCFHIFSWCGPFNLQDSMGLFNRQLIEDNCSYFLLRHEQIAPLPPSQPPLQTHITHPLPWQKQLIWSDLLNILKLMYGISPICFPYIL